MMIRVDHRVMRPIASICCTGFADLAQPVATGLAARQDSPVTQRLRLALTLRGLPADPDEAARMRAAILHQGGDSAGLSDQLALIDLIDSLYPDRPLYPVDRRARSRQRDLIRQALHCHERLDRITAAHNPRDLDLAVHGFRQSLGPLDAGLAGADAVPGNPDVVLAPLLWRVRLLDLHCKAWLAVGFDHVAARTDHLLALDAVTTVLDRFAARRFLAGLDRDSGLVARPDWSNALGPGRDMR